MIKKIHKQALAIIGGLALSSQIMAADVLAGDDYFQTLAGGSSFDFTVLSAGTVGVVNFTGLALDPVNFGNSDTIVRRLEDAILPAIGSSDTIATEMIALSLQSISNVLVGGNMYSVLVGLDPAQRSLGSMTINHEFADNGTNAAEGTFDSEWSLNLDAVFTNVNNISDVFTVNIDDFALNGTNGWTHTLTGKPEFANETNFFLASGAGAYGSESHPDGALHCVGSGPFPASRCDKDPITGEIKFSLIPVPATAFLFLPVLLGLATRRRKMV